jgi:hypothetical protein
VQGDRGAPLLHAIYTRGEGGARDCGPAAGLARRELYVAEDAEAVVESNGLWLLRNISEEAAVNKFFGTPGSSDNHADWPAAADCHALATTGINVCDGGSACILGSGWTYFIRICNEHSGSGGSHRQRTKPILETGSQTMDRYPHPA